MQRPYDCVLDTSNGITKPNLLPGAKLNIAEACFRDMTHPAIVFQREGKMRPHANRVSHSSAHTMGEF